jgi:hypothetical protein
MPADMVAVSRYLRAHSHGRDQVLAGEKAAVWIPALSGRRVIRISLPPPESEAGGEERAFLRAGAGAPLAGVRWVVADPSLLLEHGIDADALARHPHLRPVFRAGAVTVYERVGS